MTLLRLCMPEVKGRGAGLGNELIPWCRAFIAAKLLNVTCLPPAFGLNERKYWRHFGTNRLDWIRNRMLRAVLPTYSFGEDEYLKCGGGDAVDALTNYLKISGLRDKSTFLLTTSGMWGGYQHIWAARNFARSTLYHSEYAPRNLLRLGARIKKDKLLIGVHIRLGDFNDARESVSDYSGKFNISIPGEWYRSVLLRLVSQLGRDNLQFLLVSDGPEKELYPITEGLDCIYSSDIPDSDCSDLIALADCDLIVCSISSFSAWAAFLSDSPYIWFKHQLTNQEGYLSIWGGEERQSAPGSGTYENRISFEGNRKKYKNRGFALGFNEDLDEQLVVALLERCRSRFPQGDLIRYGVLPT